LKKTAQDCLVPAHSSPAVTGEPGGSPPQTRLTGILNASKAIMSDQRNLLKMHRKTVDKPQILGSRRMLSAPRLGKKTHDYARSNSICPCQ
jgi:hypothetical protein